VTIREHAGITPAPDADALMAIVQHQGAARAAQVFQEQRARARPAWPF
jgi:hypothetical protein